MASKTVRSKRKEGSTRDASSFRTASLPRRTLVKGRRGKEGSRSTKYGDRKSSYSPPNIQWPGPKSRPPKFSETQGVYVGSDKVPVSKKKGLSIAIPSRLREKGKAVTLQEWKARKQRYDAERDGETNAEGGNNTPKKKVPSFLQCLGVVDMAIMLAVALFYAFAYKELEQLLTTDIGRSHLTASTIMLFMAACTGSLPIMAARKNKRCCLWVWVSSAILIFLIQAFLSIIASSESSSGVYVADICHAVRVLAIVTILCVIRELNSSPGATKLRGTADSTSQIGGIGIECGNGDEMSVDEFDGYLDSFENVMKTASKRGRGSHAGVYEGEMRIAL